MSESTLKVDTVNSVNALQVEIQDALSFDIKNALQVDIQDASQSSCYLRCVTS